MSQHLINKPIKLKQCMRCKSYVFLCTDSGTQVAADVKPLSVEEYRAAIIAGRYTFDLVTQAGRPYMLRMRGASSKWPPYEGRSVLAEHPCTRAINMSGVELVDPPGIARASDTSAHGVNKGSAMQSSEIASLGVLASTVIQRHSKREYIKARCEVCQELIGEEWRIVGVSIGGYWKWIQHDYGYDCRKGAPVDGNATQH